MADPLAFLSLLWRQQQYLLNQIQSSFRYGERLQRKHDRFQCAGSNADSTRTLRKRAKWNASRARKAIRENETERWNLYEHLRMCQNQLLMTQHAAMVDNAALFGTELGIGMPLQGSQAWPTLLWDVTSPVHPSVPQEEALPQEHPDPAQTPSATAARRDQSPVSHAPSTDSGFHEPPLYAQPLDLDLGYESPEHVFAHELLFPHERLDGTPPPASKKPAPVPLTAGPTTREAASAPTDLDPTAPEFVSPASPTEFERAQKRAGRRYSEAAVQLLEYRLAHPKGPAKPKRPNLPRGRSLDVVSPTCVSPGLAPDSPRSPMSPRSSKGVLSPGLERVEETR